MKRIFITILLSIFSTSAYSFDYHGIESGMTKDEVQAILKCEYSSACTFGDDDDAKDNAVLDKFFGEKKPTNLKKIEFEYTRNQVLWRIRLKFETFGFGIAMPAAFKMALQEKYTDASVDEEIDRSGYFPKTVYYAFLIDSELFASDLKYWKDKFLETF